MITSVSVKNFKGFRDTRIQGLTPVTLIGGRNNAGKSSILEAIFLLYSAYNQRTFNQQFSLRGAGNLYHNTIDDWVTLFYGGNINSVMSINIQTDRDLYGLEYSIDRSAHAPDISIPPEILNQVGPLQNTTVSDGVLKSSFSKNGNKIYQTELFTNGTYRTNLKVKENLPKATIILTGNVRSFNAQVLTQLDINNKMDIVLDALRIIEPSIKSISVVPVESRRNLIINGIPNLQITTDAEIYVDTGLAKKMPLKLMGDGMGHLINFVITIADSENGLVLIDEIENGIHYSVRKVLWEKLRDIAKQFNCQIVATTHSYECLQAAAEAITNGDLSYIRLDRDRQNDVKAVSYSVEDLQLALKMNMEVR